MTELKKSPLHAWHVEHGAKLAEFGGWEMPLEYAGGGVLAEHKAVRESVGVFDVSHLGKARVQGPGAVGFLNRCLTNDLGKIGPGKAQYTLICNDEGGVIDDLIAYVFGDDEVFLIPNAANNATVIATLDAQPHDGITITNEHDEYAVIAVQGPNSDELLSSLGLPVGHDYMAFDTAELVGTELTICRTGYTGERGYELVVPSDAAPAVWEQVMAAGERFVIRACGLGARDTLRTEMGYPLHGQDISPSITPLEGRVGWAVGWKKEAFLGAEALRANKAAGAQRVLRGLKATGRGIPRHDMVVLRDDEQVGVITSGTFSPTLRTGIALALLDAGIAEGDTVGVQVRNRVEEFEVVKPPFVTPGVRE